jgi:aspartyl protease family protein
MINTSHKCRAVLLALLCWAGPVGAQDVDIDIVGLSQGRAVVVGANGKPKVYRDGDTLPNGARLIKATPESALFEIGGKRHTLTMGNHVSSAAPASGASRVTLIADERGHFVTIGSINGASIRFLVDTGATMISMGVGDALRRHRLSQGRAGLRAPPAAWRASTGPAHTVKVGEITANGVDALVHDTDLPWALLGMSFLNRVEMNRQGDNLTLVKRY